MRDMITEITDSYDKFVSTLESFDLESIYASEAAKKTVTETDTTTADPIDATNTSKAKVKPAEVDEDEVDLAKKAEKERKSRQASENLATIVANISEMITQFFHKFSSKFDLMMTTDKGFIKEYTEAKRKYKPSTGQKMVIYEYNCRNLDTIFALFGKLILKTTEELKSGDLGSKASPTSLLEIPSETFDKEVISYLQVSAPVISFKELFALLRTHCRGQKKTVVIRPSDIPKYEKLALSNTKVLKITLAKQKTTVASAVSTLTTNLKLVKNNKGLTEETVKRSVTYAKKLLRLHKSYQSYAEFYYNMKVEEILAARVILKAMYKL